MATARQIDLSALEVQIAAPTGSLHEASCLALGHGKASLACSPTAELLEAAPQDSIRINLRVPGVRALAGIKGFVCASRTFPRTMVMDVRFADWSAFVAMMPDGLCECRSRRKHPRAAMPTGFHSHTTLTRNHSEPAGEVRLVNISETGAMVACPCSSLPERNEDVLFSTHLPHVRRCVSIPARMVWTRHSGQYAHGGLQFRAAAEDSGSVSAIRDYVSRRLADLIQKGHQQKDFAAG